MSSLYRIRCEKYEAIVHARIHHHCNPKILKFERMDLYIILGYNLRIITIKSSTKLSSQHYTRLLQGNCLAEVVNQPEHVASHLEISLICGRHPKHVKSLEVNVQFL